MPHGGLNIAGIAFMGSYTRNNMDLNGSTSAPGLTQFSMTLKSVRQ